MQPLHRESLLEGERASLLGTASCSAFKTGSSHLSRSHSENRLEAFRTIWGTVKSEETI